MLTLETVGDLIDNVIKQLGDVSARLGRRVFDRYRARLLAYLGQLRLVHLPRNPGLHQVGLRADEEDQTLRRVRLELIHPEFDFRERRLVRQVKAHERRFRAAVV